MGKGLEAMGKTEGKKKKTDLRGQKEKERRGAVCDPPALHIHSTQDIIHALKEDRLPDKIMFTVHPQRWSDNYFFWGKELIWQNIKNLIKYLKIKSMEKTSEK